MGIKREPTKCCSELRVLQAEINTLKKVLKYDIVVIVGAYLLGVITQTVISVIFSM